MINIAKQYLHMSHGSCGDCGVPTVKQTPSMCLNLNIVPLSCIANIPKKERVPSTPQNSSSAKAPVFFSGFLLNLSNLPGKPKQTE